MFETIREVNAATGLALGRGSRRLTTLVLPPRLPQPTRLLIAPQDLRSSDATIAEDIFGGHLTFAGRRIDTGGLNPFGMKPPSLAFAAELHGFGWLRHARAAEDGETRRRARALVESWLSIDGRKRTGPPFAPRVVARRLISWITQSPLLLEGADADFYRQFVKELHRQATLLLRERRAGIVPVDNLPTLTALAYYALCTDGSERLTTGFINALLAALRSELLPDGGHIGRNPRTLIDLLLDLLPLQQAFSARNLKLPADIPATIGRTFDMLRLLRHVDGTLGAFNGMGLTEASDLATLLAYGATRPPPLDASYSGYQRLQAGQSVVLVDAGRPPPSRWSTEAHAGCLSFEFSARGARLIVNCGSPRPGEDLARPLARSTAAHSTLTLADTSSCRLMRQADGPLAGRIRQGPHDVTYGREAAEDGTTLVARHDGYVAGFGLVHQRALTLATDGERLEGQDKLLAGERPRAKSSGSVPFALRFHLHPSIRATLSEDRRRVRLSVGGDEWLFEAASHDLSLEESIFFATRQGRQRTLQIVVEGLASAGLTVDWSLSRQNEPNPR